MLFFLPFQLMIVKSIGVWSNELSVWINRWEEITVGIFLPLAIRELYKNREILNRFHLILLSPIIVLSISGFISGIINGNPLLVTILGIFDYIKYFLFIFIYAAFFRKFSEFKKIFHLLLIIAVFLGAVAFIQEVWALSSIHIYGNDIFDSETYLFHDITLVLHLDNIIDHWRFGIYRAPSLVGHYNLLGLYCLFFFTIYLCIKKKLNFTVVIPLIGGIFLSISRLIYTGFIFMAGVQIFKGRKWLMPLVVVPIAIVVLSMSSLLEFDMTEGQKQRDFVTYREYTRDKAIEVWKDHPFWGVGPGMFGGVVSVIYQSPVYEEYNFSESVKGVLKRYSSLDQFWPQVLAETGIIGTVAFAGLFVSLFMIFFLLRRQATSDEMKGLFTGLAIFTIVIFIYALGSPLKDAVIFTYFAFAGMGLGCINKHRNNK